MTNFSRNKRRSTLFNKSLGIPTIKEDDENNDEENRPKIQSAQNKPIKIQSSSRRESKLTLEDIEIDDKEYFINENIAKVSIHNIDPIPIEDHLRNYRLQKEGFGSNTTFGRPKNMIPFGQNSALRANSRKLSVARGRSSFSSVVFKTLKQIREQKREAKLEEKSDESGSDPKKSSLWSNLSIVPRNSSGNLLQNLTQNREEINLAAPHNSLNSSRRDSSIISQIGDLVKRFV